MSFWSLAAEKPGAQVFRMRRAGARATFVNVKIQPLADCVYGQAGLLGGIYRNAVRAQGGEDHLSESGGNLSFLL